MELTRAQLLAALGARRVTGELGGVFHAVEDRGGVRISGEVLGTRDGTYLEAVICYQDRARPCLPVCIFQALATAGRFAPVSFSVGNRSFFHGGAWSVFTADDACAFVRAVLRELEAKRLPDLDALLSGADGAAIDWRGQWDA